MGYEKHFMRVAVAVLLLGLAAVAWRLVLERQNNADQRAQTQELTSRLNDKDNRERLEFQEKCAFQAEKIFRAMGYKLEADTLQSHYHPKKGHCFMLMAPFPTTDPDGSIFTFKYLLDAYEQKSLAEYAWKSQSGKPYSEVHPFLCKLLRSSGEETICKSNEEFEQFVATYME